MVSNCYLNLESIKCWCRCTLPNNVCIRYRFVGLEFEISECIVISGHWLPKCIDCVFPVSKIDMQCWQVKHYIFFHCCTANICCMAAKQPCWLFKILVFETLNYTSVLSLLSNTSQINDIQNVKQRNRKQSDQRIQILCSICNKMFRVGLGGRVEKLNTQFIYFGLIIQY